MPSASEVITWFLFQVVLALLPLGIGLLLLWFQAAGKSYTVKDLLSDGSLFFFSASLSASTMPGIKMPEGGPFFAALLMVVILSTAGFTFSTSCKIRTARGSPPSEVSRTRVVVGSICTTFSSVAMSLWTYVTL